MKRPEEGKKSIFQVPPGQPYSESVKRHLDVYDIEMALNEVSRYAFSICSTTFSLLSDRRGIE